jgi:poly(rC)-binding protein 3/4
LVREKKKKFYPQIQGVTHRDIDAEGDDNEPVCVAQDALLRVHNAIVDALQTLHKNHKDSDKKST